MTSQKMYVLSLLHSALHISSCPVTKNSCFWVPVKWLCNFFFLQSHYSPTMDELKKQIDDTMMSIAKAKKYLLGLEKTDKLRDALELGKRRILYSVHLYTVTCSVSKTDAALTQASVSFSQGWRLSDIATLHLTNSMSELSKLFLRINRQNLVFFCYLLTLHFSELSRSSRILCRMLTIKWRPWQSPFNRQTCQASQKYLTRKKPVFSRLLGLLRQW